MVYEKDSVLLGEKRSDKIFNFTGSGRDIEQFVLVWREVFENVYEGQMGRPLRFLFAGCSSGEGILDFQKMFKSELKKFNDFLEKSAILFFPLFIPL